MNISLSVLYYEQWLGDKVFWNNGWTNGKLVFKFLLQNFGSKKISFQVFTSELVRKIKVFKFLLQNWFEKIKVFQFLLQNWFEKIKVFKFLLQNFGSKKLKFPSFYFRIGSKKISFQVFTSELVRKN